MRKGKKLTAIIAVLIIMLVGGGVYASFMQTLTINGVVGFGELPNVFFDSCVINDPISGDETLASLVSNGDFDGYMVADIDGTKAGFKLSSTVTGTSPDTLDIKLQCDDTNSGGFAGANFDIIIENDGAADAEVTLDSTGASDIDGYLVAPHSSSSAYPSINSLSSSFDIDAGDTQKTSINIEIDEADFRTAVTDGTTINFSYSLESVKKAP